MPDTYNINAEKWLSIKELSAKLEADGLPHSRFFINKLRGRVRFVFNAAKYSELKAAAEAVGEFKRPRAYRRKINPQQSATIRNKSR